MGDTDIVIHPKDREKVHHLLLDAGFHCEKKEGDEWYYKKNNTFLEVHDSLVHPHKGNEKLIEYFNNLWNHGIYNGSYFELDWNFHFCYLIQHISGHLLLTGIGFRQFLDIVLVTQNINLNWNYIEAELRKLELWEFALTCLAFCERWFGVKYSFETRELVTDFYVKVTEKIFIDGVFGHENTDNRRISKITETYYYQKSTISDSKKKFILSKVFPDYDTIISLPYCSMFINKKALLPIAWVWRWIYKFLHDKKSINTVKLENNLLKEKQYFIDMWRL